MSLVEIPLTKTVFKGINGIELTDEASDFMDGFIDAQGGNVGKPGVQELHDFNYAGFRVDGLYWWNTSNMLIIIVGGSAYKGTKAGGVYTFTQITTDYLVSGNRVIFATDGTYVFSASGGRITYTNGAVGAAFLADADAPTTATHVAWIDGYLLANNGNNKFYFSNVNNSLVWDALDFASAAGDADNLTALHVKNKEIYLFGPNSFEIWENDGVTPFARTSGGLFRIGCIAPYSVAVTDYGVYWLASNRRIVLFDGGQVKRIATPYDTEFDEMSTVSDCMTDLIEIGGNPLLIFTFPTANRTIVYNIGNETWSEFGEFVTSTGLYNRWFANCYAYAPAWGEHIVGSVLTQKLYRMSLDYNSTATDYIRLMKKTGHIDHGTGNRKKAKFLNLRLQRGDGSVTDPKMMLRWKDDNKNWSTEKYIDLGELGETEIVKRFYCPGIYRTRQWEMVISDAVPKLFLKAELDVDVLSS